MKEKLTKKFNNHELLKDICKAYGYELEYKNELIVCTVDEEDNYEYENIELALIDWLDTLIESELVYKTDNANITWKPEIEYIKELKSELLFDKNSNSLENALVYGKIPNNMRKQLSVFLDEQNKKVNSFIKISNDKRLNVKAIKASLPVEFITKDENLAYITIAKKEFIERLVKGDTSEVEYEEKTIYNKDGKIKDIPLIPLNSINKFELNIPVAITTINGHIRIQTPVNYLYLF